MSRGSMNYTYIVKCSDGTFYTGWTNDLTRRMEAHNQGRGAKYTKARRPVTLIYYETFETKEEAMKREYAIKRLSRKEKRRTDPMRGLVLSYFPMEKDKRC